MRDKFDLEYQRTQITTPRVENARREFIEALEESAKTSGMYRDQAAGKIAHILACLYDEAEKIPDTLPVERKRYSGDKSLST